MIRSEGSTIAEAYGQDNYCGRVRDPGLLARPGHADVVAYHHAMRETIDAKHKDVAQLCAKHRVIRLSLFGSALNSRFEPGRSDVDFLVEFAPMPPAEYAAHYFGLQEDLEALLSAPVELVETEAIRNPFFKEKVESQRVLLFEAA